MQYNSLIQTLAKTKSELKHAEIYADYLKKLATDNTTSRWASTITESQAADLYRRVERKGLHINGDDVTLVCRGGEIRPEYAYTAYKNAVLKKYPESTFDWGVVREGDEFTFVKEDGKVTYRHQINDPFKVGREIIGAYGIVKNNTGEFLEIINTEDIDKFRRTSQMKNIWRDWLDRMVLKSVIKRICHTAFKDITEEMDAEDENYDLDLVGIALDIQQQIAECESVEQVNEFYKKHVTNTEDATALIKICKNRKDEILKAQENDKEHADRN